jgi:diamine N-acetyltransferase
MVNMPAEAQDVQPISLRPITRENWREALALAPHSDQLRFVSGTTCPVAVALAKAYVQPSGMPHDPYGVLAGDRMVGFLTLAYEPHSADRYFLLHFFIDRRWQRRGYGTATLVALVDLLRTAHPACAALALTVHPENAVARRLYTRFGFEATGVVRDGEPAYRLDLARSHH